MSVRRRVQADDPAVHERAQHALEVAHLMQMNDDRQRLFILATFPVLVRICEQPLANQSVVWLITIDRTWSTDYFTTFVEPLLASEGLQELARFGPNDQLKFETYDPELELFVVFHFADAIGRTESGEHVPVYDHLWVFSRSDLVTTAAPV